MLMYTMFFEAGIVLLSLEGPPSRTTKKTKAVEESLVVEPSETPAVGLVIVIVGVPTKLLFSKEEKDNDRRDAIDK